MQGDSSVDSRVQPDAEKDSGQSLPVSAGVTSIPDRCPTDSFIGEAGKLRDRPSECEALRGWSRLWVAARVVLRGEPRCRQDGAARPRPARRLGHSRPAPGDGGLPGSLPPIWDGCNVAPMEMFAPRVIGGRAAELRGRPSECEALRGLVQAVGRGESRAVVLRGEPGVGKTALLEFVAEQASDCRVARAAGVQSAMELAFAALHQLLAPMLDRLERLPAPQRDALQIAFGITAGPAPDQFLVALAVLNLLSEVAEERPLICLVDDEHWLDRASAQALAFVARRLDSESVGLVFAARVPSEDVAGLPELLIEGLREADARALLDSVLTGPLDGRVRDQIVAETRGNPLALLELPRGMTPAELAGGFGLPGSVSLSGSIEDSFQRQFDALPGETRRLLQLAAADPIGEPLLIRRAAERLGIGAEAVAPAADAGLLEFGVRVRFRHPLVRSAAYRSASLEERQDVHRALAEVTDPEVDPDRRAWHLAQAAQGPSEDVASELEGSADRARRRGGIAAAAAFLARSVELTPDPGERGRRAVAAAEATMSSGAPNEALMLLSIAEESPLDELHKAQVDLVRAQLSFAVNRGSDAPPLLLKAAKQYASLDPRLARDTFLEALFASMFAGRFGGDGGVLSVAQAARAAPPAPDPPRAADLLLDGYTLTITEGYAVGAPALQRALKAFQSRTISSDEALRWTFLACYAAQSLWDEDSYRAIPTRSIQLARDAGALSLLPLSLTYRMGEHLHAGELGAVASMLEDLNVATESTGTQLPTYAAVALAAWRGREAEYEELKKASLSGFVERGEGMGVTFIEWTTAVLYNGLGKYEDALVSARAASEHREELQSPLWLHELVEAAARSGKPDLAADALEELCGMTGIIGTDWALGIEARSRALLSEKAAAERLYSEAIDYLERSVARVELARAHLLYGEWLRREGRRVDARAQLRTAHDQLTSVGAEAFAERARHELLATGERVRKRTVETRDVLTAQEIRIARFARDGLSNPEIGERLFISPRTVKYHLSKVFTKLDISSRSQLGLVMPSDQAGAHTL